MNREIKFRAWDNETKQLYYSDKDCIVSFDECGESVILLGGNKNGEELKDYTLMQYTVFKDKNFKEIYEGDIVAERTMGGINYSVVKFGEINISKQACKEKPCICFYNDYSNFNDCWSDEPLNAKKIEVIGNIYENPELLES